MAGSVETRRCQSVFKFRFQSGFKCQSVFKFVFRIPETRRCQMVFEFRDRRAASARRFSGPHFSLQRGGARAGARIWPDAYKAYAADDKPPASKRHKGTRRRCGETRRILRT